jgi:hypothetical protein
MKPHPRSRASTRAACHRLCLPWPSWPGPRWRCARCTQHGRGQRSPARTRRPNARACPRSWPRWPTRAPRSIDPLHGGVQAGHEQPLRLDEVEALLASGALVVDACRRGLRAGAIWRPLARRPVLFALARALAEAWPGDIDRNALIARAFRTRRPNETHRARLRVEIGRLRALVAPLARIEASARGFELTALGERDVVVLLPPIDGDQASLLALLADGAAWSTSALALALGASQRTVQRALVELETTGRVRSIGRARTQRWLAPPLAGFTTILLLPAALPPG